MSDLQPPPADQPDPPDSDDVVMGELVDARPEDDGGGVQEEIEHPTRLLRLAAMIRQLVDEVRELELDEQGRDHLTEIHNRSLGALRDVVSDDLTDELERLALEELDGDPPSAAQLRIAQAQLAGWLEGLFHGIQASVASRQMAARSQAVQRAIEQGSSPGGSTGQYL